MKIISKIHQKSIKNQWKWGPWGRPGTTLEVFGLMMVESDEFWPHFSRIFFHFFGSRWLKMPSRWDPGPFWAPSWGPKSTKIDPKSDLKCDQFFDGFEDRFLKRFGPILAPKPLQKWSQVGSKIDASWGVDLRAVLWWILDGFLLIFWPNMAWPK